MNSLRAKWLLVVFVFALMCGFSPSASAAGNGAASPAQRSIRNWVHCNGKDENAGVAAAFAAAKNGAFTLVVDCKVVIHVGMDIRRPIYIDNGTTVQFTKDGLFTVDNVLIPSFVIANSTKVSLLGWRIEYQGGVPIDLNTGGYYDNGVFIKQAGYDRPAFAFTGALGEWLTAHRGIHHYKGPSYASSWFGPTDNTAVFYIVGNVNNLQVRDFKISVPQNAKGSQFIPMVFVSVAGYNDNENVTAQTPLVAGSLSVPKNVTFSNITFDGYYMGWQGRYQDTVFEHIRAYRYGDLQDANGGTVGGVNKWFAPPHLFYLNYDPKQIGLENRNIHITDVIDYGQRVGVARDQNPGQLSGNANSLKLGGVDCVVDGYKSYRPDGVMDVLSSTNLTISNVDATYDSSFLHNLYPAIRFPQAPYQHVTLQNVQLTDKAAVTRYGPINSLYSGANNQLVLKNIKVTLHSWANAPAARNAPVGAAFKAASSASRSPAPNLCPHFAGQGNSADIQFTMAGNVQACH